MNGSIDPRAMTALGTGHLATDFANGALPALLPFLTDEFDLSYVLVGWRCLPAAFSSLDPAAVRALVRPPRRDLATARRRGARRPRHRTRRRRPELLARPGARHRLGPRDRRVSPGRRSKFAAYVSGRRRASGMSLFSIGGNLGYALGPIVGDVARRGARSRGGLLLALPWLAVAALLLWAIPYLRSFVPSRESGAPARGEDRVARWTLLLGVIAFRSVCWFGLITFVPLWEVSLGHSEALRQPPARADAVRRRDRDAARRAARRPLRAPACAGRERAGDRTADPRLRRRRRPRRRARARAGRARASSARSASRW